jgi:hypothetical protein
MSLSDTFVRHVTPSHVPMKLADGRGLYLLVNGNFGGVGG